MSGCVSNLSLLTFADIWSLTRKRRCLPEPTLCVKSGKRGQREQGVLLYDECTSRSSIWRLPKYLLRQYNNAWWNVAILKISALKRCCSTWIPCCGFQWMRMRSSIKREETFKKGFCLSWQQRFAMSLKYMGLLRSPNRKGEVTICNREAIFWRRPPIDAGGPPLRAERPTLEAKGLCSHCQRWVRMAGDCFCETDRCLQGSRPW